MHTADVVHASSTAPVTTPDTPHAASWSPQNLTPDQYGQVHVTETAELVAQKRLEFHNELHKLRPGHKVALEQATRHCPELLNHDLELLFLRCEVFRAELAAKRYATYWTNRVKLFGEDKAFLPLTLAGALRDDYETLQAGFVEITGADETGRGILTFHSHRLATLDHMSRTSKCRVLWYVLHALLVESEPAQRRGVVILSNPVQATIRSFDGELVKMMMDNLKGCLPVRLTAFHLCRPPLFVSMVLPIVKMIMGPRLRQRLRIHTGDKERIVQQLAPFGIPTAAIPVDLGGDDPPRVCYETWLTTRRDQGL